MWDTFCALFLLAGATDHVSSAVRRHKAAYNSLDAESRDITPTRPLLHWDGKKLYTPNLKQAADDLAHWLAPRKRRLCYAAIGTADLATLVSDISFKLGDLRFSFEAMDKLPNTIKTPVWAYRPRLLLLRTARANVALQEVERDDRPPNLFIQPLFLGAQKPLTETDFGKLLEFTTGSSGVRSVLPGGILLPPMVLAKAKEGHFFDRQRLELRDRFRRHFHHRIRGLRLSTAMELLDEPLLSGVLARGGNLRLESGEASGEGESSACRVVVSHGNTPLDRYICDFFSPKQWKEENMPKWGNSIRDGLRESLLAGTPNGVFIWEKIEEPCNWGLQTIPKQKEGNEPFRGATQSKVYDAILEKALESLTPFVGESKEKTETRLYREMAKLLLENTYSIAEREPRSATFKGQLNLAGFHAHLVEWFFKPIVAAFLPQGTADTDSAMLERGVWFDELVSLLLKIDVTVEAKIPKHWQIPDSLGTCYQISKGALSLTAVLSRREEDCLAAAVPPDPAWSAAIHAAAHQVRRHFVDTVLKFRAENRGSYLVQSSALHFLVECKELALEAAYLTPYDWRIEPFAKLPCFLARYGVLLPPAFHRGTD